MPFVSRRAPLELSHEEITWLERLAQSRSEAAGRVQRAEILLRYHTGETVSAIASQLRSNRPKEFYPGRAERGRGLQPLDRWIGRLVFLGFGLAAILNGIHNLRRH